MAVEREIDPALERLLRQPLHAAQDLVLEKVLRETDQALGREPDVPDVGDIQQGVDERLQLGDVEIGDVAARDDHVAHRRGPPEVVEDLRVPVLLRHGELELVHLGHVIADQVHPGAVPAVLRAGGQELGEHLRGVAVGQSLHHPHVGLVQAVAGGAGVIGPVGPAIRQRGCHVPAHRIPPQVGHVHGIDHLRRDEHRHRRPPLLILTDTLGQIVGQQVSQGRLQLSQVLDGMAALPDGTLPIRSGYPAETGQPIPVRLGVFPAEGVVERLPRVRGKLLIAGCHPRWSRRCWWLRRATPSRVS